jgi:SAM-dependent methyltransferase
VSTASFGPTDFYDAELRWYNPRFHAAAAVRPTDHVLDVGCGTGQTTREAARAAFNGSAVGVDVSAAMLERARRLSDAEGTRNVIYEVGDAQTHPFPAAQFDLCISRFGTMFFTDAVAAFVNIGRALRPGARLVLLVWQHPERNEWFTATRRALADSDTATPSERDLEPFSLADPSDTQRMLTAAGLDEIAFTDVHEPVYYGPDAATAYESVLRLRHARDLLDRLDATAYESARHRLRATLDAHDTGTGVLFDARAWIITARHL